MRTRLVLVLLPILAMVACGGDDEDAATAPDDTTTSAAAAPAVHVDPDGLVVDGEPLGFGAGRDDVVAALGDPTEEGVQEDCPAGPSSFLRYDDAERGLLLVLQDDELAGWSLDDGSTLTTPAGIGIGSTKAELESAHGPVEMIPDSTLGIEFFYEDGMTGLLAADAPDGTITAIWSGVACVFR